MINLFKADLFRLRKSRVYKIVMIVMMIIIAAVVAMSFSIENDHLFINTIFLDDRIHGFLIGDVRRDSLCLIDNGIVGNYMNLFRSSLGLTLFICIGSLFVIGDFVISRYENGVLKNTISYGNNRYKIYISNLLTILIGITILAVSTMAISMLALTIVFTPENSITSKEVIDMLKITIIWTVILCGVASFYTAVATIIRNKALLATGGALFMTLISAFAFSNLSESIRAKISIYMITDLCGYPRFDSVILGYGIQSLFIIVLSTIIGCIIFSKQEIK